MSNNNYRKIIIPGKTYEGGNFEFVDFKKIVVDIPKEFLNAAWGYGYHYGRVYGRGL